MLSPSFVTRICYPLSPRRPPHLIGGGRVQLNKCGIQHSIPGASKLLPCVAQATNASNALPRCAECPPVCASPTPRATSLQPSPVSGTSARVPQLYDAKHCCFGTGGCLFELRSDWLAYSDRVKHATQSALRCLGVPRTLGGLVATLGQLSNTPHAAQTTMWPAPSVALA